jgi:hypothetical protein
MLGIGETTVQEGATNQLLAPGGASRCVLDLGLAARPAADEAGRGPVLGPSELKGTVPGRFLACLRPWRCFACLLGNIHGITSCCASPPPAVVYATAFAPISRNKELKAM